MVRYVFSDSPLTLKSAAKADPQKIGEELAVIAAGSAGRLTPHDVLAYAEAHKRSAIAKHIEWDDAKAATAYRLDQCREIVRVIRVIERNGPPTRAYLSIGDAGGTAYRAAAEVATSRDLQLRVLQQAERDLAAWEKRYSELADLCEEVRMVRDRVSGRRAELEARA
jgi:hypothetical protein